VVFVGFSRVSDDDILASRESRTIGLWIVVSSPAKDSEDQRISGVAIWRKKMSRKSFHEAHTRD
jgi:hypothetical protein